MANDIIIFGIILSIIFYEITEISPGGLIVPAYIAFYINTPQRIIITIIAGILTFLIVKFISNHTIIYGRRKICTMYHDKLYGKTHIKIFQYLYSERI